MSFPRSLILLFITTLLCPIASQAECVIKMTYKDGQKPPFIKENPSNTGAYQDIFTMAAEDIGCTLTITRMPKKRLHVLLKRGDLDFYPGTSFSLKRAAYLYFIPNGFTTRQIGLTRSGTDEVTDYSQLKEYNMTWLMEVGSSKVDLATSYNVKHQEVRTISINKARQLLLAKRCDFYVADEEPALYYLNKEKMNSWQDMGLQTHENCCGGHQPMYLGFSRNSGHFKEIANPNFDNTQAISIENNPTILDPSCVAYKFGEALQRLQKSGKTQQIYNTFFYREAFE